jgi:hypothetical protein
MATWGIWLFVISRRTLTSDLGENGVKTLVCVCVCVEIDKRRPQAITESTAGKTEYDYEYSEMNLRMICL